MRVDLLAESIARGERPAVVHTVSNFHNPGGVTMSPRRRQALAALAEEHGFWVIEDDPYGDLFFDRPAPLPVASYSRAVIRLSSASKIIAPTLRVGWMVAPERVCRAVELLKQGADLCGSALTQQIAAELLADTAWLTGHLDTVRGVYATRAAALVDAARTHFGDRLRCSEASGGMFVWAEFTDDTDTSELLPRALDAGVAFVPGRAFAVSNPYERAMRMCFTTAAPEVLAEAMTRLARAADLTPVHSAQS